MPNLDQVLTFLATQGANFALKALGALAAWIVGRWLIALVLRAVGIGLARGQRVDATLISYLQSILGVLLNVVLVLAILDIFGVQTTSFAALLAGAGLAIGTAWGGLLTHFAAGLFLQVLRPFKVGDFVKVGGVMGTVREIGLFTTSIVTLENVVTIVGNNKVFSEPIENFSTNPVRRVDCTARIANGVDPLDAIERLKTAIAEIPNVSTDPAPDIEILEFTLEGPMLAVRPYTHTDHYWQVYFDTHRAIVATFGAAGYPVPEMPLAPRNR
ncbi:MAG: mechanosensitive ion channel family protein [Polyangiaceae bacterium]|nr:mechanosensitive ion channel family protein [Polyangiaceae bacterium]